MTEAAPPPSASSFAVNLAGGICFILSILAIRTFAPDMPVITISLIAIAAGTLPILIGEIFFLRVHKRPRAILLPPRPVDRERVGVKIVGYMAALVFVCALYLLFPEYRRNFYAPFFTFAPLLAMVLAIGGWLYIDYTDRRLPQPEDSLYHLGLMVCGRWREADRAAAAHQLRSILLRTFFMPIMYVYMTIYLSLIVNHDPMVGARALANIPADTVLPHAGFFTFLMVTYLMFAAVDVLFAIIGYLMTFRPLDSDIRSVEPTITGWVVCLVCYYPFWEIIFAAHVFKEFYKNPAWYVWFADNNLMLTIWGTLVILAMISESFTTMTFGARFSNLTYRGLISSGPFRFTKHPQYISKMLNRFLFYIPVFSLSGFLHTGLLCFSFLCLCFVYYLRARTEENHLSRFPEYVEYAQWIDNNGIFRFIGKIHPALKFNAARAQAGKLLPIF